MAFVFIAAVGISFFVDVHDGPWQWSVRNLAFAGPYLPVFIAGMAYWTYLKNRILLLLGSLAFMVAVLLVPEFGAYVIKPYDPNPVKMLTWVAVCIVAIRPVSRIPPNPITGLFSLIGRYSLAVFLYHYLLLELVVRIFSTDLARFLSGVSASFIIPIAAAILLETMTLGVLPRAYRFVIRSAHAFRQ